MLGAEKVYCLIYTKLYKGCDDDDKKVFILSPYKIKLFVSTLWLPQICAGCAIGLLLDTRNTFMKMQLDSLEKKSLFRALMRFNRFMFVSILGDIGKLLWNNNWISFLDTMLQMSVLGASGRGLRLPTRIKAMHIDPLQHQEKIQEYSENKQGEKYPKFCINTKWDI